MFNILNSKKLIAFFLYVEGGLFIPLCWRILLYSKHIVHPTTGEYKILLYAASSISGHDIPFFHEKM